MEDSMESGRVRHNTAALQGAARGMRQEPTSAEAILWKAVRNKALGFKVRRQHPVGRFILDFWIPEHRLAIELDGDVHDLQPERDAERTRVLAAHDYRVIRFRNEEVFSDLSGVLQRIRNATNHPPRHPLSQGLGEGAGG